MNFCRGPLSASVWPRSRYANALLSHERLQGCPSPLSAYCGRVPKGSISVRGDILATPVISHVSPPRTSSFAVGQIFEQGDLYRLSLHFFKESVDLITPVITRLFTLSIRIWTMRYSSIPLRVFLLEIKLFYSCRDGDKFFIIFFNNIFTIVFRGFQSF